jgi:hypothetical protein
MTVPSVPPPDDIRRPLIGKLKKNWLLDVKRHRFVGPQGRDFDPTDELPPESTVDLNVPMLAKRPLSKLSAAEKDLMRYVQIILPKGVEPESQSEKIAKWPCFESVTIAPRYELPKM